MPSDYQGPRCQEFASKGSSAWPVGVTAVSYGQDGDRGFTVVDDIQCAIFTAHGRPDCLEWRVQGLAQSVGILGNGASQMFIQRRGRG